MKNNLLRGVGQVFSFSFGRSVKNRGFIATTVIIALLLFIGVACLLVLPNALAEPEPVPEYPDDPSFGFEEIYLTENIAILDKTGVFDGSSTLTDGLSGIFKTATFTEWNGEDRLGEYSIGLVISQNTDGSYSVNTYRTGNTAIPEYEAYDLASIVAELLRSELIARSGIDMTLLPTLGITDLSQVTVTVTDDDTDTPSASDGLDEMREIVGMVVSYVMIMFLYFMIIFFGQLAANSVMLEKTSKLMDFFLVSVRPAAMILGKVLAAAATAFLQVGVWIASAVAAVFIGKAVNAAFYPDVSTLDEDISALFAALDGLFTPASIIVSIIMIAVGFLLYCSLSSIGGAMASKPEDLSTTNAYFTLILVASFFLSLFGGEGLIPTSKWLIYFPFTAILTVPGRLLTGSITLIEGIISTLIVAIAAFLFVLLAGKVYTLMSFYRGNPPTPKRLISMLLGRKKDD